MLFKTILVKIVIIGDGGVGKTSIIKRYIEGGSEYEYIMTLGVDTYIKESKLYYDGRFIDIKWHIWDFGGQFHWVNIRKPLYRGAAGGIIVFDVANQNSYERVTNWVKEMISISGKRPLVLVGNKIDLRGVVPNCLKREDGLRKAKELSELIGMEVPYIEVSALKGINIDRIFSALGNAIMRYAIERLQKKRAIQMRTP